MSLQHSLATLLADTLADGGWRSKARPEQLLPDGDDWNGVAYIAGRGWGKTRVGAEGTKEQVESGSAKRIALVAPTAADARDTMVEGESGILAVSSDWCRPIYEPSKRKLTWPNGAIAHTFSSEECDRLRGPQFDFAWADEVAAWNEPQAAWDMLMFGLRLGRHPRWIVTTTPRPIKLLKDLLAREGKDVVVRRGSTFDNAANLAGPFLEAIRAKYEGTRLGRQELNAELLEDNPGALWTLAMIDADRVRVCPPLTRIVLAVDPAVTSAEDSAEWGIVAAGQGPSPAGVDWPPHYYVLDDLSLQASPEQAAALIVGAYQAHKADRIVAEVNNGS